MSGLVLVLHSTQGQSLEGAVSTMDANRSWSHDVICPRTKRIRNLVPYDQPARSLLHPAGTPQTNNRLPRVIQVEIVGFANRASADAAQCPNAFVLPEATDDELRFIGEYIRSTGVPFVFPRPFLPYPESYGPNNGVRLTWDEWADAEGVFGHEHIPGNDHGDPGELNTTRIIQLLTPEVHMAAPQGSVDTIEPTADGKIRVTGWALDPDDPAKSIQVHVYIESYGFVGFVADKPRPDVNAALGVPGDHGFDITVSPIVTNNVRVFAIDTEDPNSNALLGQRSITIPL